MKGPLAAMPRLSASPTAVATRLPDGNGIAPATCQSRMWRLLQVVALAALTIAGCESAPHACPDIGAASGVQVAFASGADPAPAAVTVRACAGAQCVTWPVPEGDDSSVFVPFDLTGARRIRVSVTISVASRTILDAATEVAPTKRDLGSRGCPLSAWIANVTVHADGTLTS